MTRPSFALAGTLAILASLTFAAPGHAGSTTITATGTSNQLGGGLLSTEKPNAKPDDLVGTTSLGDSAIVGTVSVVSDTTVHEDKTQVTSRPASSRSSALPVTGDFSLMTASSAPSDGTEGASAPLVGSFRFHLGGFALPDFVTYTGFFALLGLVVAGSFAVRRFFSRRLALT
jgi:hypothetical protein